MAGNKCNPGCECRRHLAIGQHKRRREVCQCGVRIVQLGNARTRRCPECFRRKNREYRTALRRKRGAQLLRYKDRTHCRNGHPLAADGAIVTFVASDRKSGKRQNCHVCLLRNLETRRARKHNAFIERVDPMRLYKRDNGVCGICKQQVYANAFHVDHIIPLSKGGAHSYANTQIAHPTCNHRKHAKLPEGLLL